MNTIKSVWKSLLLGAVLLFSGSANAIEGATLGLALDYPQIETNPIGGCTYTASTGILSIDSQPTLVVFNSAGTDVGIVLANDFSGLGGTMNITANIDNSGTLSGGTLDIQGYVSGGTTDYGPGSLLTGTITDYGMVDDGATEVGHFRFTPTGGAMFSLFSGNDVGIIMQMTNGTYTYDPAFPGNSGFANDWSCEGPKSTVGPTPGQDCDLVIEKTVSPTQIGPFGPISNDSDSDSDSDSGNDNDGSGDSDDSDSDSGDDSVDSGSVPPDCGCKGKVSKLTLKYNGGAPATVTVTRKPHDVVVYGPTVLNPGDTFLVDGTGTGGPGGFQGTLGTTIEIAIDQGAVVEMHTSCSQPIGPGLIAGDFEVIDGFSKKFANIPLCPVTPTCPGEVVTYTYTITNNGAPVTNVEVVDDKLGLIGTILSMNTGDQVILMEDACITETTTNNVTATADGGACASNTAQATVEVLLPPDPDPCNGGSDTDSDSGHDNNGNNDSDDSDSDSGDTDCDADSDTPPPEPLVYEGCSPGYWKNHQGAWGDTAYSQGDKFDQVFLVDAAGNKSLLKTIKTGGGKSKALGRHAVAALLNASNPNVDYFYSVADVKDIVVNAYATYDWNTAKNMLRQQNTVGCPLN